MAMRAADMQRSFAETLENCRRLRQRLVEESELIRLSGLKRRAKNEENRTDSTEKPRTERYEIDIDETNEAADQTFPLCPVMSDNRSVDIKGSTYYADECLRLKAIENDAARALRAF